MPRSKQQRSKKTKAKQSKFPKEWLPIAEFFTFFDEDSSNEHLWQLLKLALTSVEQVDANELANMLFFYEHLKDLIENTNLLLDKQRRKIGFMDAVITNPKKTK